MGFCAFKNCNNLKFVEMKCHISKIPDETFSGCAKLEQVILPSGTTEIGEMAFMECKNLQTLPITASVKKINSSAFNYCIVQNPIVIPEGVKDIMSCAFIRCKAPSVFIPASVGYVGRGSFEYFYGEIRCESKKPLFGYPKNFHEEWIDKGHKIEWNAKKPQ